MFTIENVEEADIEFLALPRSVQETFITAFRELAASESPMIQGPGWFVDELRQRQRVAPEGLFSLHVGSLWRGVFYREGGSLIFIGFGYRLPEFYAKLARLRKVVSSGSKANR